MRFTGQVKIPDLDYPGVPASVHVDGKQVELFVEGESLGRWSLVDVRAERLVSSAFSLKLAGEEVTFIADQPTEFAYGGVEAMANVWAKHKSMRLPLRIVANSRSRQGTKPSRIPDLRDAIEEALAGTTSTAPPARREASGVASLRATNGPAERKTEAPVSDDATSAAADRATEPDTRPLSAESEPEPSTPKTVIAADTEPEHTLAQHDPIPESPDTPDAVLAEPEIEQASPPPVTDSVFKQNVPWATGKEADTDARAPEVPAPPESEEDEPGADQPSNRDEPEGDAPAEGATASDVPEATVQQTSSVPWLAPPPDERHREAATPPPEPAAEEGGSEAEPEYVVDLGAFEDRGKGDRSEDDPVDEGEVRVDPAQRHEDDEDEEVGVPMATTAARGGIMGAVRSAFVRNRVEHTHVYLEAPGGLGIKRQICTECGHISIGVE